MKQIKTSKLNGKDFMNIGIFAALNLVISIVVACTIGMIPMGFILLTVISPLVIGIPSILFYTKITKFGMLMIYSLINGLVLLLTGMGVFALISGLILSFVGELILKAGQYKSGKLCVLTYAIVSISTSSNYIQWLNASEEWLATKAETYGESYMLTVSGYFSNQWVFPVCILLSFMGGLFGGLLGKSVLRKHFEKSGLV